MFVRPSAFARVLLVLGPGVLGSGVLGPGVLGVSGAFAQTGPASDSSKSKPHNKYGSPLDTIMSTRLWTNVPPAPDFVKKTHPDVSKLDYTPLNGKDPVRPKPRDPANIQALQAELEQDLARNQKKAGLGGGATPAAKHARKNAKARSSTVSAR